MANTAIRLLIASGLVVLLYLGTSLVRSGKAVIGELPERDFQEMPLQFGPWRGEEVELDPRVFMRTGADIVVDRAYRDDTPHPVSVHVALFRDPDVGIFHSPMNCYRVNGWQVEEGARVELQVADNSSIPVSLTTWKREGERILVMYWYQLGEHVVFDRWDLGKVRLKMAGGKTWPALIKVLMQTSAPDLEEAEVRMRGLAAHVHNWVSEPDRGPTSDSPNE